MTTHLNHGKSDDEERRGKSNTRVMTRKDGNSKENNDMVIGHALPVIGMPDVSANPPLSMVNPPLIPNPS